MQIAFEDQLHSPQNFKQLFGKNCLYLFPYRKSLTPLSHRLPIQKKILQILAPVTKKKLSTSSIWSPEYIGKNAIDGLLYGQKGRMRSHYHEIALCLHFCLL